MHALSPYHLPSLTLAAGFWVPATSLPPLRSLIDVERENRRLHLLRAADLPAGWSWNPNAPLFDGHLNITPNYQGLLASVFAYFDTDQDGLLSLAEINALQSAKGKPQLTAEALRDLCATAMSDFDPQLDCGLSAVGFATLSLRSLLSAPAQEAATYARLGFTVNGTALPSAAQRASFLQLRTAEILRRPCPQCMRVGCTMHLQAIIS